MSVFTAVDPTLVFAGLDLLGFNEHEGAEFYLEAAGDDMTWGNPVPIDVWIASQLQDGSIVYTQRQDNREMFLRVKVEAADGVGLQAGEDALAQACNRRTTLEWTPPDGAAATTVFLIHTSHLEHLTGSPADAWDVEERRNARYYGLRVTAAPFTRSVDKVTLTAEPDGVAFTETVIDECTSTTGWTGNGTVSLLSGQAVRNIYTSPPVFTIWLERAGSVVLTQPYVRVKGSFDGGDPLQLVVDGTTYDAVAQTGGQWWYAVPAGTYSTFRVTASHDGGRGPSQPWTMKVWSLYQTNTTGFGSRRELARRFSDIPGSVRAPGDLVVSHPSTGLGDVLIYVYPDTGDYSPSLQQWRSGGGSTTSDSTLVSGKREPLDGGPTFTIPSINLPPAAYHVLVRLRHTSTSAFTVTYDAEIAGTTISRTVTVSMAAANTWQIVSLGTEHYPPVRVRESSDRDVTLTLDTPTAGVEFDAGWLFRATEVDSPTALIQVAAGSELDVTYQVADVDVPHDLLFVSDFYGGTRIEAMETPNIVPPSVRLYLVTTGTNDAEATLDYYPHWHGHAGL